jgi:hypothetical protein
VLSHAVFAEDLASNAAVYGRPLASGGMALQLQTFDYGSFDAYDGGGTRTGSTRASDLAFGAAYGRPVGEAWRAGVGLKSVQESIAGVDVRAWAADAGVQYAPFGESWLSRLRWGAALRNLGGGGAADRDKTPLPQSLDLGVAYQTFSDAMTVELDVSRPRDGKQTFRLGQEVWVHPVFALRAGYAGTGNGMSSGWSAGFAAKFRDFRVDYAFSTGKDGFDAQHRAGIAYRFGGQGEALYQQAVGLIQAGDYAEAVLKLKKVLDADPRDRRAIMRMKEAIAELKKERGEAVP